jgi:putative ABC transport system permease protein
MLLAVPIAWLQLTRDKLRLLVAVAGVAFAVVLVCMQLGFQDALFRSSVRYHTSLRYDLAMLSPKTDFIVQPQGFSRRRLQQVRGEPGVAGVTALYLGLGPWKNPEAPAETRSIFVLGVDPADAGFALPGVDAAARERLKRPDVVLFDAASRPEFGPIPRLLREAGQGGLETEVANRGVRVAGLFELGTSFGIDASLVTSDLNFRRIFPQRRAGQIDVGLIHLDRYADPERVRDALAARLPPDVEVVTRAGFVQREVDYWAGATPIGYVFSFGVVMGLVVGGIIVYQILFADVSEHLREYATLKAIGYTDAFLFGVVLQQALLLALLGFGPGLGASWLLYRAAGDATRLPLELSLPLALGVLGLTALMCAVAGSIALRKVRQADPAEIF